MIDAGEEKMDSPEHKEEGKECCSKAKCCGAKALIAIALVAAGGLGGYFAGRNCGRKSCPAPAVSAEQAPTK